MSGERALEEGTVYDLERISRIATAQRSFSELSAEEILVDVNELRQEALQRLRTRDPDDFEDIEDAAKRARAKQRAAEASQADQALVMQTSKFLVAHLPKAQHQGVPKVTDKAKDPHRALKSLSHGEVIGVLKQNRVRAGEVHGREDE